MSTQTTDSALERRIRQLLLLQETAKKVNSIFDLEQLLDEIVGGVAEAFGCNRTAVLLKDDNTNELDTFRRRRRCAMRLTFAAIHSIWLANRPRCRKSTFRSSAEAS